MLYRYHSCPCSLVSNALWWLECSHSYAFGTSLFKVQRVPFKRGCGHLNSCYNESIPKWSYSEWPEFLKTNFTYRIEQWFLLNWSLRRNNSCFWVNIFGECVFHYFFIANKKAYLGSEKVQRIEIGKLQGARSLRL